MVNNNNLQNNNFNTVNMINEIKQYEKILNIDLKSNRKKKSLFLNEDE